MNWEIGINLCTPPSINQITNEKLHTKNSTQYSVMGYMGKESKKEPMYVYV